MLLSNGIVLLQLCSRSSSKEIIIENKQTNREG